MNAVQDQYALLPKLEEVLRRRVCPICVDYQADGLCKVDERHDCALFNNLPRIARSIALVTTGDVDDYIAAIREDLCESCCSNTRLDGSCEERDEVRCALDRHMVGVIGTIEEIMGIQRMAKPQSTAS